MRYLFLSVILTGLLLQAGAQQTKELRPHFTFRDTTFANNAVMILRGVYYQFDKADLRQESWPQLDSVVIFLQKNPNLIVEIGNHVDKGSNAAYIQHLSMNRASNVVQYLVTKGIERSRLQAKGYGTSVPYYSAESEPEAEPAKCYFNRRTEIKIIAIDYRK